MRKISYIDILHEMNSGGTSKIFFGVDTRTGFPVAVKELDPHLFKNPEIKELFIEEANRYLYLEHPNIVKLEDLLLLDSLDTGYLVMEFIEGKNLKEHINKLSGPLPFVNAALFIYEALKAIEYVHDSGILHNDIKPSNIMLTEDMRIKVIDFGISIDVNRNQILENMFTPYYASPEQTIPGRRVDKRTDIYSMGITLFELVMGRPPFSGNNLTRSELIEKVRTEKVPPVISTKPYDLPFLDTINHIIQKATQKDPDYRYQDCETFMNDLEELLLLM